MKKRVLILSFSPIHGDPRVMRQVQLLEDRYEVTVAGFGEQPSPNVEFFQLISAVPANIPPLMKRIAKKILGQLDPRRLPRAMLLLTGRFEKFYWEMMAVQEALKAVANRRFDLVLANDIPVLPLALKIAGDSPVMFDAHEYSPREFEDRWHWRLSVGRYNEYLCRTYIHRATVMTTVGQAIADEYRAHFDVDPQVIRNSLPYRRLPVTPVQPERIRLVHHGIASPSRHLDRMILAMRSLDRRFTLDLMLVLGDPGYLEHLRQLAAGDDRIRFRAPVPLATICETLNHYDLGIAFFPPVNFNYRNCLPNKFFEFVQARLGVVVGPSPEMAELVRTHRLGVVSAGFESESLAEAIGSLTDADVASFKRNADSAAENLNFEVDGGRLLTMIEELIA